MPLKRMKSKRRANVELDPMEELMLFRRLKDAQAAGQLPDDDDLFTLAAIDSTAEAFLTQYQEARDKREAEWLAGIVRHCTWLYRDCRTAAVRERLIKALEDAGINPGEYMAINFQNNVIDLKTGKKVQPDDY